jgi:DNA-binding NarL/FixJ family response regulator
MPKRTAGASDERRHSLLEAAEKVAAGGSWQWSPSKSELIWSENLFRIFGVEPGEIEPTPEWVFERTHPDDRERVSREVERLHVSGELTPLEYRIVRPDQSVRHLRSTLAVSEWSGGLPHVLLGWVQDMTEQLRAEREIAAHVAVARALTEWESLETGAERLLGELGRALEFVAGTFWVPCDNLLSARVVWLDGLADLPDYARLARDTRLPRGVGVAGEAWESAGPVGLSRNGDRSGRRRAVTEKGIGGAVAVPAVHGDQVLAVVELVSQEKTELTDRLMQSLTGIGYELGGFLARRSGELEGSAILTPRELEVIQLAAQGLSAQEIAEQLVVSPATIRTHLENIHRKLEVSGRAAAVAKALRLGLIE